MKELNNYSIGEIVVSTQGRDCGTVYLVLKVLNDNTVYLVNGKTRLLANPKHKKTKHIKSKNQFLDAIREKFLQNKKVFDEEIFSAFKKNNIDFFEKEIECLKKI